MMQIPIIRSVLILAVLIAPLANAALFRKDDPDKAREKIQEMRETVLQRLYSEQPATKAIIANSVGYAVFDNTGINLLVVSTANGKGVAHDKKTGKDIYMSMFSAGGGFGAGIKTFSAIFAFHTQGAFDQFVEEGWDLSAQADVAATTDGEEQEGAGSTGLAMNVDQEVSVYQLTEKGLALQATLQGTKYWKNKDLN
jgi:lipid-binding SYLF domain-containing protein